MVILSLRWSWFAKLEYSSKKPSTLASTDDSNPCPTAMPTTADITLLVTEYSGWRRSRRWPSKYASSTVSPSTRMVRLCMSP